VGGFFFDFEAIRTESRDRDAPRRSESEEEEEEEFGEGTRVSWSDKKGSYTGVITKKNPKTVNILADTGESKRVPFTKLTIIK